MGSGTADHDDARGAASASASADAERAAARAAEAAFVAGLSVRGEVADADSPADADSGKLPPGTTHVVVGCDDDGRPVLARRRFSIT